MQASSDLFENLLYKFPFLSAYHTTQGYLGDIEVWNRAEAALELVLNKFGHPWKLNPGDGAFYGPKVRHGLGSTHA